MDTVSTMHVNECNIYNILISLSSSSSIIIIIIQVCSYILTSFNHNSIIIMSKHAHICYNHHHHQEIATYIIIILKPVKSSSPRSFNKVHLAQNGASNGPTVRKLCLFELS